MKTLQGKMLVFFSLLLLIGGSMIGFLIYRSSTNLVIDSVGMQARLISENMAKRIPVDDFVKIVEAVRVAPDDEANQAKVAAMPEYVAIRKSLNEYKEANGLKYLYTMVEREPSTFLYVVDGQPLGQTDDVSLPGQLEANTYEGMQKVFQTGQTQIGELNIDDTYGATITAYVPLVDKSGHMIGIVGADFDATAIYQLMAKNKRDLIFITVGILAFTLLLSWLFAHYLVKPLRRLTGAVQEVRKGNLAVQIEPGSKDEIGILAQAFGAMVSDLNQMVRGINESSYTVSQSSHHLELTVEAANRRTEQMARQVEALRDGAEEQSHLVQQTSQTIVAMSREIDDISARSQNVQERSQAATQLADQGNMQITQTVEQMKAVRHAQQEAEQVIGALDDKSQEISEIVHVITGIAAQTNLLALNAAIEAARAGEAGKGFAVVAEEVRKLADQSGVAASHIESLIADVQSCIGQAVETIRAAAVQMGHGVESIQRSGSTFLSIMQAVHVVNEQIDSVAAAAKQLSAGSERLVDATKGVEGFAVQTSQAADHFGEDMAEQLAVIQEVSASTEELSAMAAQLHALIRNFKTDE
ncbi:methyl-accepting chemotaxis protein [Brevibacillus fluminis]|uniref:methyl-accepting chemotaxis protein n=1 Tax=Brevibacillus fluminis TaxID=511487 RepID=UPI003F899D6E